MLNKLQQKVYDEVIYGNSKKILLLGPAGSGKSTVTAEIINAWSGSIAITATTNKAAQVLSQMSEVEATTTHRQLGFRLSPKGYKNVLHQVREADVADLVIIEEISMLPKVLYKELLDLQSQGLIKKLLFLGDPLQLPAVSGGIDIKDIKGTTIELKQSMRQDASKVELLAYLKAFRKAIETKDEAFDPTPSCEDIVIYDSHKDFCRAYNKCDTNKKLLAHRNSIVDRYNQYINGGSKFNEGDEVIIDKPLGNATNGDTVIIKDVEEDNVKYILTVVSATGVVSEVWHYKSNSVLLEELDRLRAKGDIGAYWELHDIAYRLKHVYASTIYKSQGSTYDEVFIDGTDIVSAYTAAKTQYTFPISHDMFLRLLYVAISRMKTKCHLFLGDKREYKYLMEK